MKIRLRQIWFDYNVYAGGIQVVMQFMKFLLFCYTGQYTDCKIFTEKC